MSQTQAEGCGSLPSVAIDLLTDLLTYSLTEARGVVGATRKCFQKLTDFVGA